MKLVDRIREQLKAGPLTATELSERLNADRKKVLSSLCHMAGRSGGVVSLKATKQYALIEHQRKQGTVAGRILIRGYGDVYSDVERSYEALPE
jgi:hypothetical protein